MGIRGRFFLIIVLAAFAANFTVGTFNRLLWLVDPPGGYSGFWMDAGSWFQLGLEAVLAVCLWIASFRIWQRIAGEVTQA